MRVLAALPISLAAILPLPPDPLNPLWYSLGGIVFGAIALRPIAKTAARPIRLGKRFRHRPF